VVRTLGLHEIELSTGRCRYCRRRFEPSALKFSDDAPRDTVRTWIDQIWRAVSRT